MVTLNFFYRLGNFAQKIIPTADQNKNNFLRILFNLLIFIYCLKKF